MKLKVASRRLKRTCVQCDCSFNKGDSYWMDRQVSDEYDHGLIAYTQYFCPRCKYKKEDRKRRRVGLQERCRHPKHMIDVQYSYIPGEAVMQPDYYQCLICAKVL